MALGYWRKPDLTRKVFQPDLEGGNKRIYLTGDLGRLSLHGYFEHLGRKDFQVNIRGQNVQLSAVELCLLEHPGINAAVVADRTNRLGEPALVAYVVPVGDRGAVASELRSFLQERLPQYMVPWAFVTM